MDSILVVDEDVNKGVGCYTGLTKWFSAKLGFGFITIHTGPECGKDVFVHHTGIRPLNSNYKTLIKGEYVNFNMVQSPNGKQAVDVTGVHGGPLMCDHVPNGFFASLMPRTGCPNVRGFSGNEGVSIRHVAPPPPSPASAQKVRVALGPPSQSTHGFGYRHNSSPQCHQLQHSGSGQHAHLFGRPVPRRNVFVGPSNDFTSYHGDT